MRLWQCSECRTMTEDCKTQCQLITDNDIEPTECIRLYYFTESGAIEFKLTGVATWNEIEKEDLLEVFG